MSKYNFLYILYALVSLVTPLVAIFLLVYGGYVSFINYQVTGISAVQLFLFYVAASVLASTVGNILSGWLEDRLA